MRYSCGRSGRQLLADGGLELGIIELQRCRLGRDGDRLGHFSRLSAGIHGHIGARRHIELLLHELAETGTLHRDGVGAGFHKVEQVMAGSLVSRDHRHAGIGVQQSDLGANDGSVARIRDGSLDSAAVILSNNRARRAAPAKWPVQRLRRDTWIS